MPRVRRILIDSFSENLAPGLASLTHYSAMGGWAYFRDEAIILIATEADPLAGKSGWLQLTQVCITAFETEDHLIFSAFTDDGQELDEGPSASAFLASAPRKPCRSPAPQQLPRVPD